MDLSNRSNYDIDLNKRLGFISLVILLIGVALISIILAVSIGQVEIPPSEAYRIILYQLMGIQIGDLESLTQGAHFNILWQVRFPRVLMAMVVGAGLASCGTVMQASVQNPLADPYILGISAGAALGATFSILIGFGSIGILRGAGTELGAFMGAIAAAALVLTLAGIGGKLSSIKLVLSGTVISALCSAFSNFIIYFAANTEGIRSVTFWTMGSLASAKWDKLAIPAAVVAVSIFIFLFQTRILNTLLLGDEAAVTLGIDLNKYRRFYMVMTSIITGVVVAACGIIGFVGLIIPHITRSIVGSDHKRLLPISILIGSIFLVWTDVIARVIVKNSELPIGIITALVGAPFFMYMLIKKGYGFGGK